MQNSRNPKQSQIKSLQSIQQREQKLFQQCLYILRTQSLQQNNKWLIDHKINSYSLRNDKASQIVNTTNYIMQKYFLKLNDNNKIGQRFVMLQYLFNHYKSSSKKVIQFCHLLKHFSLWDYQFQFFYALFLQQLIQNVPLYLNCRNHIIQSNVNKYKKTVLSGVLAEIQQWSKITIHIFKQFDQRKVVQQFVQVVKMHFMEVKKNQNQRINGAQFFKICQIMSERLNIQNSSLTQKLQKIQKQSKLNKPLKSSNQQKVGEVFRQSMLNDLTSEDRQLIRVLSYKDKNIARLLEQKHNKMVNIIGEQVDKLRSDIQIEKNKYLDVINDKNTLQSMMEKMKKKVLQYIIDNNVKTQQQLFLILQSYNKRYSPHVLDVSRTRKQIENKRLLQIIQAQQRLP